MVNIIASNVSGFIGEKKNSDLVFLSLPHIIFQMFKHYAYHYIKTGTAFKKLRTVSIGVIIRIWKNTECFALTCNLTEDDTHIHAEYS